MATIRVKTGQKSLPSTPDPTDVVFHANVVVNSLEDGQWRPLSSISRDNAPMTDPSEPENADDEERVMVSLRSKSRVSIAPAASTNGAESPICEQGLAKHTRQDQPPTRATSTMSHRRHSVKRRLHLRTAPGKLEQRTTELNKAFVTMDDRSRVTFEGIKGNARTSLNAFDDRVCRPYSVYTVTQKCERLAISPFGGPLMNSAAGRYRERYLTKHRPDVAQDAPRGDAVKTTFQRFYENMDLLAINVKRIPFGKIRKPPPKQARKVENRTQSVPTQLHKYTSERIANLHESMDRQEGQSSPRVDGKRLLVMGVEYKVAMEVSSNLEKHRKSRPSNLPGLPNLIAARLQAQVERLLTPGELSLKDGISSNLFDSERNKRGPIKIIEKPPRRVKSPPLSKLSREKFLPEAQRRRDQETWAELRIGRPVTPPASEYTAVKSPSFATTVQPLTAMTTRTGVLESGGKAKSVHKKASKSSPNPENDTTEEAGETHSHKEITEIVTAELDEKKSETVDKISNKENNKTSDYQNGTPECSVKENDDPNSAKSGKDYKIANNGGTPSSSRSLVVTIPDGDAPQTLSPPDVVTGVICEDGAEVTSKYELEAYSNNAIPDEGNVVSADSEKRTENTENETDDQPVEEDQSVKPGKH